MVLHEREVTAFHVGALWQRPLQSVFDDCGSGLPGALFFWSENILCAGSCPVGLCLLPDVFQEYEQDLSKRSAENQWYLKKEMKVRGWWQRKKKAIAGRKEYKIYKCPKCGQKIRVPRHKGKIAIRCRKCGEEFIRKT